MHATPSSLKWIDNQRSAMVQLVKEWADINSSSDNLPGLAVMLDALATKFKALDATMSHKELPPRAMIDNHGKLHAIPSAKALHVIKRPQAPVKVFLGGHMDTVYPPSHVFQKAEFIGGDQLRGPGVADMKGGLVVMLTALQALERESFAKNIGWEIVINPDEETGSAASEELLIECAKRNDVGLIFEPAFADGALVSSRKGSVNFTLVARGQAAHVGRDFDRGRNAIGAIARFIVQAHALSDRHREVSVSAGQILGGGPVNVIPDFCLCRLNARAKEIDDFEKLIKDFNHIASECQGDGIELSLHIDSKRKPKPFDQITAQLFEQLKQCAKEENINLTHRPSGGVCDGNLLQECGLPVIDTLGVVGGEIHTSNEFMILDSLVSRARLTARFLISLASEKEYI